ncbi:MAG TPA: F0F1 ATP synthase subunit beta, partial [Oscillatoriaceae cyanobacterium]
MAVATETHIGEVTQVIGPVIVVNFPSGHVPAVFNALRLEATTETGRHVALTAEVQQHLGDNR